eukprot:g45702.t1
MVEYGVLFLRNACGIIVALEEAQDGHVAKGVGGGIEMAGNRKMLLITEYRVQMLHELVTKSAFGLNNVEEISSGATDTVDQAGGCTGESLSDLERLYGALDGAGRE